MASTAEAAGRCVGTKPRARPRQTRGRSSCPAR